MTEQDFNQLSLEDGLREVRKIRSVNQDDRWNSNFNQLISILIHRFPENAELYYWRGYLDVDFSSRFVKLSALLDFEKARNMGYTLGDIAVSSWLNNTRKELIFHTIDYAITTLGQNQYIPLLKSALDDTTLLGKRFWKQEGAIACSLESGTLKKIKNLLGYLEGHSGVRDLGMFANKKDLLQVIKKNQEIQDEIFKL